MILFYVMSVGLRVSLRAAAFLSGARKSRFEAFEMRA